MICAQDEKFPEVREEIQSLADKIGADYDTAKIIYENNNGYSLDKAPSGAESKLYQTLLEHYNGDERKALIAKAKTYLQPFFDWFGNWTDPEATDVSKVVDENGEPLIVYHSSDQYFEEFKHGVKENTGARDSKNLFFFSSDQRVSSWYTDMFHGGYNKYTDLNTVDLQRMLLKRLIGDQPPLFSENELYDYTSYAVYPNGVVMELYPHEASSRVQLTAIDTINTSEWFNSLPVEMQDELKKKIHFDDTNESLIEDIMQLEEYNESQHQNYDKSAGVSFDALLLNENILYKYFIRGMFLNVKDLNTITKFDGKVKRSIVDIVENNQNADGFVIKNTNDSGTNILSDIFAVRQNSQIKPIDGLNTFNAVNVDIFNNLTPAEINEYTPFVNTGFVHKYNNGYFISKNKYNSPKQLAFVKHQLYQLANDLNTKITFVENKNSIGVVLSEVALADKLDKDVEIISNFPSKNRQSVSELFEFLQSRFPNLKGYKIVSNSIRPGANAWIQDNIVYLVDGKITTDMLVEECLHPFVNTLYNENPDLFNQIYNQAKKEYGKLNLEIESTYTTHKGFSEADRKQELVAQSLSREFNDLRKTQEPKSIKDFVNKFIDWFKNAIKKAIQYISPYGDFFEIDSTLLPKMSLRELAELINTTDTVFTVTSNDGIRYNIGRVTDSEQLLNAIQKGLKQRLESVKRYSRKNIKVENELNKLIQELSQLDSLQGTVEFVDHLNNSIGDSIRFLERPVDEINYKQIRQLSEDYVGFYKPLLDNVQYLLDTTDEFRGLPEYNEFRDLVGRLVQDMNTINNRFINLMQSKGRQLLVEHLKSNNAPQEFIDRILNWLNSPTNDGNFLTTWLGMSSNSSNEVVGTIENILTNTMNQTQRETYRKGIELVKILQAAKDKYGPAIQELLYEKYADGTHSGYLVRDLNYGQMNKDIKKDTAKLAEKLNITKDDNGLYVLPEDEATLKSWTDGLNKIYSKYANRRFTDDFYDLRNKMLSQKTKAVLDEINHSINQITDSVTIDGVIYENLLSIEQQNRLESLRKNKKFLSVEYNLDGTIKQGDDLLIAQELKAFYEATDAKYTVDWARFKRDEERVIKRYGKNSKEHLDWKAKNTRIWFTKEFYDALNKIEKSQQSEEYKKLLDKRRQILSVLKDSDTGTVNTDTLSDSDRAMLKQLDQDIADLYTPSEKKSGTKFSDIAEIATTEAYSRDFSAAQAAGTQVFNDWFNENHYEDVFGNMKPCSFYTRLQPKDESRYTENVPYGRYSTLDPSSKYANKEFDINGPALQPKRSLYDNSKAFKEITSKPELKALYDAIHDTMLEANKKISYMVATDNYKMPQMEARMLQVMSRQNGVLSSIGYAMNEVITRKEDDTDYVDEFVTKPNGKPLKVIPTRYIKTLDNPNNIATDAVAAVVQYYDMACNYSNMSEQQDKIELLLSLLESATYTNRSGHKGEGSMEYYKQAQLLVDRIMYGRKRVPLTFDVLGKEINASKALDSIRNWISKVNLSYNINSIGTSFFTDATFTTIEAKLGRFFDASDLRAASRQYMNDLPDILANTGNPIPTNLTAFLMQYNQVVKENQEIFDRLDQSAALRAVNQNFWYLGYTQSDYAVKSHTLLSIYNSYKLIEGEGFMSRNEYIQKFYPNDRKKGKAMFNQLQTITLRDAYQLKDGIGSVKDKYAKYVTKKIENDVKNKIDIISRRIDGTLREVDKSKIHINSITSYLTQHRNFMISGLHDRFKGKHFNQDLGVTEDGAFRSCWGFLGNVIGNKHFTISQLLADYDNLQEYEQYAVQKVLNDLTLATSATIVALTVMAIVDGDDDFDNWFTQEAVYLALRSAFEFRTMYNPMEFMSLIKSPTAAFSYFDNQWGILGIFNPFNYIYAKSPFDTVDRGVYKGMPRILKTLIKVTPAKNIIEAADPKAKRNYLQNQLMSF